MIKAEDLESKIQQLETTLSNENSLYIQSKLSRAIYDLLEIKSFPNKERLQEIYNSIKDMAEPNDFYTYKLNHPETLESLKIYYKEVIELLKQIKQD